MLHRPVRVGRGKFQVLAVARGALDAKLRLASWGPKTFYLGV